MWITQLFVFHFNVGQFSFQLKENGVNVGYYYMDEGNSEKGYDRILERHEADFEAYGIHRDDIVNFMSESFHNFAGYSKDLNSKFFYHNNAIMQVVFRKNDPHDILTAFPVSINTYRKRLWRQK